MAKKSPAGETDLGSFSGGLGWRGKLETGPGRKWDGNVFRLSLSFWPLPKRKMYLMLFCPGHARAQSETAHTAELVQPLHTRRFEMHSLSIYLYGRVSWREGIKRERENLSFTGSHFR